MNPSISLFLLLLLLLSAPSFSSPPTGTPESDGSLEAPLYRSSNSSLLIDLTYIVAFKNTGLLDLVLDEILATWNLVGSVLEIRRFDLAFLGLVVKLNNLLEDVLLAAIRITPGVTFVQQDSLMELTATQASATWGLDRIDQRGDHLDSSFSYQNNGQGTRVFVLDTGIQLNHQQFQGRALHGYSAINDGNGSGDCHGHGTHVAGIVAGVTYGVAKKAKVVSVRVLGCGGSGPTSDVIAGIDWVIQQHEKDDKDVISISLGSPPNPAADEAVLSAINSGITVVVAAGNAGEDACNTSPARVSSAIVVGATAQDDSRASFSNFGSCVSLFAPGVAITSSYLSSSSTSAVADLTGTSMAAPFVSGTVAAYLSREPETVSPLKVKAGLLCVSTKDVVTNQGQGSPDALLYSRVEEVVNPDQGNSISESCAGNQCTEAKGEFTVLGGTRQFFPSTGTIQQTVPGYHRSWLESDVEDLDLHLHKWDSSSNSWVEIASSTSSSSTESIVLETTPGDYVWEVTKMSGTGSFNLTYKVPSTKQTPKPRPPYCNYSGSDASPLLPNHASLLLALFTILVLIATKE